MLRSVLLAASIIAGLLGSATFAVAADTASDAEQVKRQAVVLPKLKQSAVAATGYSDASVNVKSTAHRITVTLIDSKLVGATAREREIEASKIASAIGTSIAGKPEFGAVVIIHVDYVQGQGSKAKIIDGIDFNRDPKGDFRHHVS